MGIRSDVTSKNTTFKKDSLSLSMFEKITSILLSPENCKQRKPKLLGYFGYFINILLDRRYQVLYRIDIMKFIKFILDKRYKVVVCSYVV